MRFALTQDHIKLLQNAYPGWNDCEFGSPGIDCKRPYGSKHPYKDMAKILDLTALDNLGHAFSAKDEHRMDQLHKEMETVLLIMFRTLKAEPGEYEIDGFNVSKAKPQYIVRSDDYMVFSLNPDGQTYSIMSSKVKFPQHLHHKYSEQQLLANGFFIGRKEDFPEYTKKQNEFYERMGKEASDSHQ